MRPTRLWPVLALFSLCVAFTRADGDISLSVPGRANSTPSVAALGSFVAVAWGASAPDGATDVFVATSHDGGRAFTPPVRVNDIDGDARLNGEQPPQLGLVPRAGRAPAMVVVWTTKGTSGTRLLHARSDDGGRMFARSTVVPGTDEAGNRGWQAVNVEPSGRVDVIWLDHRELAADSNAAQTHHEHAGGQKMDGVAMAQKSKLYFASVDGSLPPRAVTGGVCYCCKTALASGPAGRIYAAWRHVYPGNLRDMAFTMSRDDGRSFAEPVRVSQDKWMLEGCPDDGPSMAVDAKTHIHLVWPTLVPGDKDDEPTIGIFYATSSDGATFSPRDRIPTEGVPHHPRIVALATGQLIAAWDESSSSGRRVAIARGRSDDHGHFVFRRGVLSADVPSVYPTIASVSDGVIVAWTSGTSSSSAIRVRRLPANVEGTR
jgi:hypothetical protein